MGEWIRTLVGLLTLAAMAVGGFYLFDLWRSGGAEREGVRLILRFSEAHGVPVGGAVRHKGVQVGEVLDVDVSPDDSGVIMDVTVAARFRHTLHRSSRFWIVRPYFGGLTEGASGLDTLIKDPYLEYDTPDLGAPLLPSGSVVFGRNVPPAVEESRLYADVEGRSASLRFKVRFSSAQGLRDGAPVLYRDLPVGIVRSVDLSLDGRYVEAEAVLKGRFRETVRADSVFWIARPDIEFGFFWPALFNVRDMSKLLTGTALAYATPTDSKAAMLKDNDVLEGAPEPPKDRDRYEGPLVSVEPAEGSSPPAAAARELDLCGVSYAFVEEGFFSDSKELFQGTGLRFLGPKERALVLTARTLADGTYSVSDFIGDPDITHEDRKVIFSDHGVAEATLVWIDPEERDLAVVAPAPGDGESDVPPRRPRFAAGGGQGEYYLLVAFRPDDATAHRTQPIPANQVLPPEEAKDGKTAVRRFHPGLRLSLREWCGALLLDGQGGILGLVGRRKALSDEAVLIPLSGLPDLPADSPAAPDGERGG